MTRRDWIKYFSTGVAGAMMLDPEKLLWVPGEKTIFLPATTALEADPTAYSLWQLAIRVIDCAQPNEFSTKGLMGHRFEAAWEEVLRTDSKVILQERLNAAVEHQLVHRVPVGGHRVTESR